MGLRDQSSGFLLMEALLAILILASFTTVLGMYWCWLHKQQKSIKNRLMVVSQAADCIDEILWGAGATKDNPFCTIAITKQVLAKPHIIKGSIDHLDDTSLVIVALSWQENNHVESMVFRTVGER